MLQENNNIEPSVQDNSTQNSTPIPVSSPVSNAGFEPVYQQPLDIDMQSVSDMMEIPTSGFGNLEINDSFKKMIADAAVHVESISYPNVNAIISANSGTSMFGKQDRQQLAETKGTVASSMFDAIQQEVASKNVNNAPGYTDPFYFGAKKFNADRYQRHPRFADLGFHPFADNESYYQANSSKWDNFTRTRSAFADMYGPAFTSGWRSIGDVFTGNIATSDFVGAAAMSDAMRIGSSTSGGARGFFNDMFLNSAYTFGIISSIAVEEVALALAAAAAAPETGGASVLGFGARTVQNIGRAANSIGNLFDVTRAAKASAEILETLRSVDKAKDFWNLTRTTSAGAGRALGNIFAPETAYAIKNLKTAANTVDNVYDLAGTKKVFGAFYRDLRAANGAWSESKMEGGMVELEMRDELYAKTLAANNGLPVTDAQREEIYKTAQDAGLTTTLINAPLIFASNRLVLDSAFRGFKPLGRMMDESLTGVGGRILRNPSALKDAFYDAGKMGLSRIKDAGLKGNLRMGVGQALKYSTANFAEGLQELGQEATSFGVKNYYEGLYNHSMAVAMDLSMADAYMNAPNVMDSIGKGIGSQFSGQGLETFASGFLMGGIVQGPQKILFEGMPNLYKMTFQKEQWQEYKTAKEEYIKNTVKVLNEVYNDPAKYFDQTKLNAYTQKQINERMLSTSYADDTLEFIDAKDHAIFSHLSTVFNSGKAGEFKDLMQSYLKLNDTDIKGVFESVSSTPEKLRSRVQNMLSRYDEIEKNYKAFDDKFVNPFDRTKYKKDSNAYNEEALKEFAFNHAKMMTIFTKDQFEQALVRANEIYTNLSADPVIGKLAANDIAVLTNPKSLQTEMSILAKELELEAITPEEKIIKEQKKKKLQLLQNWMKVVTSPENLVKSSNTEDTQILAAYNLNVGQFDRRKISNLKQPFLDLLNHLAETNDDFVNFDKVDETLKLIVDYQHLKRRASDYNKAFQVLSNPEALNDLSLRYSGIMKSVWLKHKSKTEQYLRVKKYIEQEERRQLIVALSEKDIFADPEETKDFLENGNLPKSFYGEEGQITQETDPANFKLIEGLISEYRKTITKSSAAENVTDTAEDDGTGSFNSDDVEEDEDDLDDSVLGRIDFGSRPGQSAPQAVNLVNAFLQSDKGTQDLLKAKYEKYAADWTINQEGTLLSENEWLRSEKGGAKILRARYELDTLYKSSLSETEKANTSFEKWLLENTRNVDVDAILSKHNVSISDVSLSKFSKEGLKTDKIKGNETIESSDVKNNIYILKTTLKDKDTGKDVSYYTVVDDNAVNLYGKYKALDPNNSYLQEEYISFADAKKAASFIKNNSPKGGTTFTFAGQTFKTGEIIKDAQGKEFVVKSTDTMVTKFKNLYISPLSNVDEKVFLTEDQFKIEKFQKKSAVTFDVTADKVSKLRKTEPIQFFAFDAAKVKQNTYFGYLAGTQNFEDVQEDYQDVLRNLSPLQKTKLSVVIERNPEFAGVSQIDPAQRAQYKLYDGKDDNKQIRRGANEFIVTLVLEGKPIALLQGPSNVTLLDVDGSMVNPIAITAAQAERIFITGSDTEKAAQEIRTAYAVAQLANEKFADLLGDKQNVTVNLFELDDINISLTEGTILYKDDSGKNAETPWSELEHNTVDEEGHFFIIDNAKGRVNIIHNFDATNSKEYDKFTELGDVVANLNDRLTANKKSFSMGRYVALVKIPNGTYTFVQLKTEEMSSEQKDQLFNEIKERSITSKEAVLDKNGNIKEGTQDFNYDFNSELGSKYYIAGKPGEYIDFELTADGALKVEYRNSNSSKDQTLYVRTLDKIDSFDSLLNYINKNWDAKKSDILFKSSDFKISVPKIINDPTDLADVAVATINPKIRGNIKATLSIADVDSAKVQAVLNANSTISSNVKPKPTVVQPQETTNVEDQTTELVTAVNQDLANEFNRLKSLQEETYKTKFNAYKVEIKSENESLSAGQVSKEALKRIKADAELLDIEAQLNNIKSKLAFKITDTYDETDVEDLDVFVNWAKNNLPSFISIENINTLADRLKNNGVTVGAFVMELKAIAGGIQTTGKIFTGKSSPFRYHEAFHSVFRMMLTDAEISKYIAIAKKEVKAELRAQGKSLQSELDNLKKLSPIYSELSANELEERYYEEWLADKFEEFKADPRSTKTDSQNKSLFNKIIEWIMSIFNKYSAKELDVLFNNINTGKYKTSNVQNNRFTNDISGVGVSNVALKAIKLDEQVIYRPYTDDRGNKFDKAIISNTYLPANDTNKLITSVGALYLSRLQKVTGSYNPKELLDDSIFDYIEMLNPERDFYHGESAPYDFAAIGHKLQTMYDGLSKNTKDIFDAVEDYLTLFDVQIDDFEVQLDQAESEVTADGENIKSTEDYDTDANQIGGFKSLSKEIRIFIATTSVQEQDAFGNAVIDDTLPEDQQEYLTQPVNYVDAYNGLLKAIAGTTSQAEVLQKMNLFAENSVHSKAVIEKIFAEIGITTEDIENGNFNNIKNPLFFQSIVKGFQQFRTDYIFVESDPEKGIVNLFAANHKDDASTQIDKWNDAYDALYNVLTKDAEHLKKAVKSFDLLEAIFKKKSIKNDDLNQYSKEIATDLFNTTGIKLSVGYIKFSILSNITSPNQGQQQFLNTFNDNVLPISQEDLIEIRTSIKAKQNLFSNFKIADEDSNEVGEANPEEVDETSGDVRVRLKKLAKNNAPFDETIGNTVFRDPKGNLIYAHQLPTYHLEKIAELNSEDAINELKKDAYLSENYLLNNPKFVKLALDGKLRITRLAGSKITSLDTNSDGEYVVNRGLDLNKPEGVSFGESSPSDFIAQLVNLYLVNYNNLTGKVIEESIQVQDEFGNKFSQRFTTVPVDIRIIEASNTGDFVALPVIKAVSKDTMNQTIITQEYLDAIMNEIENEYNRIKREAQKEEGYTTDNIVGYNDVSSIDDINDADPTKHRAFKLYKTGELLTVKGKKVEAIRELDEPNLGTLKDSISKAKSKAVLKDGKFALAYGLTEDEQAIVSIGNKDFIITYKGLKSSDGYSVDYLLDILGDQVQKVKDADYKNRAIINGESYYTKLAYVADFINGKVERHLYTFEEYTDQEIKGTKQIKEASDDSLKVFLEKEARKGTEFKNLFGRGQDGIVDVVKQRLLDEVKEFNILLNNINATSKISKHIKNGLETSKNKVNKDVKTSMELLNLRANDPQFNLSQIFLNDYLNTLSINQILLGDEAVTLKDAVDAIKRAKMQNASGTNASSLIAAPKYGVKHAVKNITAFTFQDPKYTRKYNIEGEGQGDKADAQMYMTTKAFRYMWFGLGKLNAAQAAMLDKIEKGQDISAEEFFGNKSTKTKGLKDLDGILNSKKLVYGDGKTFIKMSGFILTPQLTTDSEGEALPGKEKLHNLRLKMEAWENEQDEDGNLVRETVAIAYPVSASKMLKKNITSAEQAFDNNTPLSVNNTVDLDARWMRLQQVNPSNKSEIVDPRQMKQLITSEQDNSVEVIINGVKKSIGDIKKEYNKTIADRVTLKYTGKRNLLFSFSEAMDEVHNSINQNGITVELYTFLKYASAGLKASKAKTQFLDFFDNENSYDLNNPITISKFEELFMSYFSADVMSEKQPGHAISLVSDVGMQIVKKVVELDSNGQPTKWEVIRTSDWKALANKPNLVKEYSDSKNRTWAKGVLTKGTYYLDDLRANVMEYDENGKPTGQRYSEYMLPAHFADVANKIKPGESIPDVIAKAFGTRIPSQDKHSSINLKLVDFLPVYYGSSGVFPEDLIEISGADFDIDKLYVHVKEFYTNEKGEFKEYGRGLTETDKYVDYLRYMAGQASKPGTSMALAVEQWNGKKGLLNQTTDTKLTVLENSSQEDILDFVKNENVFAGALSLLQLPISFEDYKGYKLKHNREPYVGVMNNDALNQKFALLGNDGMTVAPEGRKLGLAYEPAVIDPLNDLWNEIKAELPELAELVEEEGIMVDNLTGKLKAWTNNKEGSRSIGAVVLPNIVVNLLGEYGVKVSSKTRMITLNGNTYDDFATKYVIDPTTGEQIKNGARTQYIVSALVTAMTDNAKERLAAKLGLNKDALGVVVNLVALGVDVKTATLLINHPTIKALYYAAINKQKPTDPGIASLVNSRIKTLQIQLNNDIRYAVTTEVLASEIRKGKDYEKNEEELLVELSVLEQFRNAHDLKETTSKVQALVTLLAGMGKDFTNIESRDENITELGIELNNQDFEKAEILIDTRKIFKDPAKMHGTFYKVYKEFSQQLLPSVFINRTEGFNKLNALLVNNLTSNKLRVNAKVKDRISKDVISYLTAKAYIKSLKNQGAADLVASLSNGLIYDAVKGPVKIENVLSDIKSYLKENGKENYFIDTYVFSKTTKHPNNKSGINQAVANFWSSLSDTQVTNLQNSFLELYSDIGTRANAMHLVHYLLVKDGLQFKKDTFLNVIPAVIFDNLLASVSRAHDVFKQSKISDAAFQQTFGMTFNELAEELTLGYTQANSNWYLLTQIKDVKSKFTKGKAPSILYNKDESTIYVDAYSGTKAGVVKQYVGKNKVIKRAKYVKTDKVIDNNLFNIGNKGFYVSNDAKLVKFPVVISAKVEGSKSYKFFTLNKIYTPLTKADQDSLFNINESQNALLGTRAEYVEINLKGSNQQTPIAFAYGELPDYDTLQVESADPNDPTSGLNIDGITNKIESQIQSAVKLAQAEAGEINFKIDMSNVKAVTATEKGLSIEYKEKDVTVDESEVKIPNFVMPANPLGTDAFSKLKALAGNQTQQKESSKLVSFWDALTDKQRRDIVSELNIEDDNVDTLLAEFNKTENQFTEEEFIEHIKTCYK